MAQKYKMTGCAKFFIFLIIAAPLSYIAASYYNGSDPFERFKKMEIFKSTPEEKSEKEVKVISRKNDSQNANDSNDYLKKELELKDKEIKYLKQKIKSLEDIIEAQKKELN